MKTHQLPNSRRLPTRSRSAQRGAASLLVALMLLLGGTIIAFFANRGFIFEQRTSANQYRATKAFELAEAGVEWGLGKFNEGVPLVTGASCATGGAATNSTFRARYATPMPGVAGSPGRLLVSTTLMPRCRVSQSGAATCDCQETVGTVANLGTANNDQGHFGVRFAPVAGDDAAVEIIARGCTNGDAVCDPLAAGSSADATAVVRIVAKVVPVLPSGPAAALTAGSLAVTGGTLNVVNTDLLSNGITIHAGAGVQTGSGTAVQTGAGVTVYSLPGSPSSASIVDNDPALNNMTAASEDARFAGLFGQTLTHYSTVDPDVIRISGCAAAACAAQVMSAINSGVRNPRFFIDGDVSFDSNTVGSLGNEVVVVSSGAMTVGSSVTAHGVFYAATSFNSTGTSTLYGAVITRGAFNRTGSGTLNLVYEPSLWRGGSAPTGRLVRLPGSWRDKASEY
jgi:Tfp pilus assembly protein PilX